MSRNSGPPLAYVHHAIIHNQRRAVDQSTDERDFAGMHTETGEERGMQGEVEGTGSASGCKYNRGVSRGRVKWPWRTGVRRIGRN